MSVVRSTTSYTALEWTHSLVVIKVVIHKVDKAVGDTELEEPIVEKIHRRVLHWRAQVPAVIDPISRLHWIYYGGQHQWMAAMLEQPMYQGKPSQQDGEVTQFKVCENPFSGGIK